LELHQVLQKKLDKIAPPSTRRKKIIRTTRTAYLIKKEKGTKGLLGFAKKKITKKSTNTTLQNIPQAYIQAIKEKKTKFDSNLIKIKEKPKLEHSLRNSILYGSHNITNLSQFPKVSIIIITSIPFC